MSYGMRFGKSIYPNINLYYRVYR